MLLTTPEQLQAVIKRAVTAVSECLLGHPVQYQHHLLHVLVIVFPPRQLPLQPATWKMLSAKSLVMAVFLYILATKSVGWYKSSLANYKTSRPSA